MFVTGSALVDKKQTARVNALTTGVGRLVMHSASGRRPALRIRAVFYLKKKLDPTLASPCPPP